MIDVSTKGRAQLRLSRAFRNGKMYLCFGGDAGGGHAVILYSLIGTCKKIGLDPSAHSRDLIARVSTHPPCRITELTPRGGKARLPGSAA